MKLINYLQKDEWNQIVKSFDDYDIYFLNEYTSSLMLNGGFKDAFLFYFEEGESKMCFPMLIRDISDISFFSSILEKNVIFDMASPYGYSGPLLHNVNKEVIDIFKKQLLLWCGKNNIISGFFRFHPLLMNAKQSFDFFDSIRYIHHTVSINTISEDIINDNLDSKNRNIIRRAQKNGVTIEFDNELNSIDTFIEIYNETMNNLNASDDYFFSSEYYNYLKNNFRNNTLIINAKYCEETICSSIFFYDEKYMHYHLSGSNINFRHLGSNNLLLYEASLWAAKKGIKYLHLGGGLTENDSLFGFKKQFNKKEPLLDYYVGKIIFDKNKYDDLLDIRERVNTDFDRNNNRLIQYEL